MKLIIPALVAAAVVLTGCSSGSEAAPAPAASAGGFDRNAELREAWQASVDTFPAALTLEVCEAADQGGAAGVEKFLTGEEMPFVIEHPEYDAKQWVKYCA